MLALNKIAEVPYAAESQESKTKMSCFLDLMSQKRQKLNAFLAMSQWHTVINTVWISSKDFKKCYAFGHV